MLLLLAVLAGASAVDITPPKFPVIVNGMFLERIAEKAHDRIHVRALVLDDGATRVAIAVVDSCMVPRDLLDQAKHLARERTNIPVERMMISATHTHSAPAAMSCLGTDTDPAYPEFLVPRIAEAIAQANSRLEPARIGWGAIDDFEHTHNRRWIFRPDKMRDDPFGQRTVRANMHPGYRNPDAIGPSGPVDPQISLVSVQSSAGRPLALLANYSMHYFGSPIVSSDYFGLFADKIAARTGAGAGFVAMMSQGTSGDQMWMDYGAPKRDLTLDAYAQAVTDVAWEAYRKIEHRDSVPLAMAETVLALRRRVPDAERLAWAKNIAARLRDGKPRTQPEVYAREQIFLDADPVRELKLQALRIGDIGITAIPNEVFAITGLKLKAWSPLPRTFNIELANGAEGYIPPPEQHELGGYTTWPARTAALEVEAEPKIVETLLGLLEKVSGKPRRSLEDPGGEWARRVLAGRPEAYWRMGEISGRELRDETGRHRARYEGGAALYLDGPQSPAFGSGINRAPHLAGGRIRGAIEGLGDRYSVELWFWNGLPGVASCLFERGADRLMAGAKLEFGGVAGRSGIAPMTWNHAVLARDGRRFRVYLNAALEMSGTADISAGTPELSIGGRQDGGSNFEGKIDEAAVYRRALKAGEIARRHGMIRTRPSTRTE